MSDPDPDTRRILLLRGVNVGGVLLPMAGFRQMLTGLGLTGVATFIQSGNAVFRAKGDPLTAIAAGLRDRFGLAPDLFLYTLPAYAAILKANPYAAAGRADGAKVHIFFLSAPITADLSPALALAQGAEALTLTPQALYLNAPNGVGQSKLAERLGRILKTGTTARNQRSAEAILALAEGL